MVRYAFVAWLLMCISIPQAQAQSAAQVSLSGGPFDYEERARIVPQIHQCIGHIGAEFVVSFHVVVANGRARSVAVSHTEGPVRATRCMMRVLRSHAYTQYRGRDESIPRRRTVRIAATPARPAPPSCMSP